MKENKSKVYKGEITKKIKEDRVVSYWTVLVSPFSSSSFINGGSGNSRDDFAIAYGANVEYKDGTKWPTSKKKIGERLEERYWYEFNVGQAKTFKDIDSLEAYLTKMTWSSVSLDKKEIDQSGFEEYYFTCR